MTRSSGKWSGRSSRKRRVRVSFRTDSPELYLRVDDCNHGFPMLKNCVGLYAVYAMHDEFKNMKVCNMSRFPRKNSACTLHVIRRLYPKSVNASTFVSG